MKVLTIITALMGTSVAAQQGNDFRICDSLESITEDLANDYGESIQMILSNDMSPNVEVRQF